ncbi:hypothetical protein M1N10_04380, partial [Thermodesulfovibrionales bacterium]|nr:hypothetical protein [Thermodesulfovibrionales bacterium]
EVFEDVYSTNLLNQHGATPLKWERAKMMASEIYQTARSFAEMQFNLSTLVFCRRLYADLLTYC